MLLVASGDVTRAVNWEALVVSPLAARASAASTTLESGADEVTKDGALAAASEKRPDWSSAATVR